MWCDTPRSAALSSWPSVTALVAGMARGGAGGASAGAAAHRTFFPDGTTRAAAAGRFDEDEEEDEAAAADMWAEVDAEVEEAGGAARIGGSAGGGSKNLLLGGGSREERRDERVARALAASYLRRQHDEMSEAWRRSLAHAAATGSDPRTLCSLDDPLTQLALGRQAAFARGAARADGPRSGGGSPQSPRSGARAERRGQPQRRPVARDKFPG